MVLVEVGKVKMFPDLSQPIKKMWMLTKAL
jgi:hypothetical protein